MTVAGVGCCDFSSFNIHHPYWQLTWHPVHKNALRLTHPMTNSMQDNLVTGAEFKDSSSWTLHRGFTDRDWVTQREALHVFLCLVATLAAQWLCVQTRQWRQQQQRWISWVMRDVIAVEGCLSGPKLHGLYTWSEQHADTCSSICYVIQRYICTHTGALIWERKHVRPMYATMLAPSMSLLRTTDTLTPWFWVDNVRPVHRNSKLISYARITRPQS